MTPTADTRHGNYGIVEFEAHDAHRQPEVQELLARCEHVDRRPPLGDHAICTPATIEPTARAITIVDQTSLLAAYAQATPNSAASPTWTIDIAIDPGHRHEHDTIVDIALRAILGSVRERTGSEVQWWRHEPTDNDRSIAERHGLLPKRQLLEMHTRLDAAPADPAIRIRPFISGVDDLALLEVNNMAFAHHPDQGNWTRESLTSRFNSTWFDPAGLLIHTDDHGTMLGFCWTKIHDTPSTGKLGEIYVIAVRPSHHGRGLGRTLTQAGLASLHERGLDRVMLFVDGDNTAARTLYRQLGFTVAATSAAFHSSLPEHKTPTNAARRERRSALRVQVCDGCCCGTERKHPGVDHAGIRELLAAAAERAGGQVRVVGCVDECSRSNVVIVRPAGSDLVSGAARTWIGDVLDDDVVQALCGWISTGATAPQPPAVAARVFHRAEQAPVESDIESVGVELRVSR